VKRLFLVLLLISSFAIAQVSGFKIAGLETFKTVSSHKDGTIVYPLNPPVGGVHNPVWQNCGIYDQAVRIENVMHSLEHGAVWITYKTDLSKTEVETLRNLVRGQPYIILSPYSLSNKLEKPIYAVAWGVRLGVTSTTDLRIPIFAAQFKNNPQTTPEFGAACTNGIGNPIQ
jgi:Protein of unknown function (DUF3105)